MDKLGCTVLTQSDKKLLQWIEKNFYAVQSALDNSLNSRLSRKLCELVEAARNNRRN